MYLFTTPYCTAFGRLAFSRSIVMNELVDSELRGALEWLEGRQHDSRRLAAVLVLSELAQVPLLRLF